LAEELIRVESMAGGEIRDARPEHGGDSTQHRAGNRTYSIEQWRAASRRGLRKRLRSSDVAFWSGRQFDWNCDSKHG